MFYDINGNELDVMYDISSNIIWRKAEYTTFDEAVKYAYEQMMAQSEGNKAPFCLITDQHTYIGGSNQTFVRLSQYADWDKMLFIDLGDDDFWLSYAQVQSQDDPHLNALNTALSTIPAARQFRVMGNHDTMWVGEDGNSHGADPSKPENAWVLEKYYSNVGCSHIYGADYVMYDDVHNLKYVSVSGWDYDPEFTENYAYYLINGTHLEAIISELGKADGYDVVILSHAPFFSAYDSKRKPATDGYEDRAATWYFGAVVDSRSTTLNNLLVCRNNHTAGSVNDSYGVAHAFDFSGTTGKVLCNLAGHEHTDAYGYKNGILMAEFDSMYYNPYPIYLGLIDKDNNQLDMWKVDKSPMVYHYQIPFNPQVT